jgi:hypothetical protein
MFGFVGCASLNDIVFSPDSHLRDLNGFCACTSLCRIEIPSSVEVIGMRGFLQSTSLSEIDFSSDSHLREIDGFRQCTSLCRIEIPSSVEMIGSNGFRGCTSLRVVIIRAGCRMRFNQHLRSVRPFLVYEEGDMNQRRSLIHLGFGRR